MKKQQLMGLLVAGLAMSLVGCGKSDKTNSQQQSSRAVNSSEVVSQYELPRGLDNFYLYANGKKTTKHLTESRTQIVNLRESKHYQIKATLPLVGQVVTPEEALSGNGAADGLNYNINTEKTTTVIKNRLVNDTKEYFKAGKEKNINLLKNATDDFKNKYNEEIHSTSGDEDDDKRVLKGVYLNSDSDMTNVHYNNTTHNLELTVSGAVQYDYKASWTEVVDHDLKSIEVTYILKGHSWVLNGIEIREPVVENDLQKSQWIYTKVAD